MTVSHPLHTVYSGQPKLALLGVDEALSASLAESDLYTAIEVQEVDGAIRVAAGGRDMVLTAPFSGHCAVVSAGADTEAALESFLSFWSEAGLDTPPVVAIGQDDGADPRAVRSRVMEVLARTALADYAAVCREASLLDKQIAVLRDEVEDARNKWRDAADALTAVTGGLPTLGYELGAMTGDISFADVRELAQMLPFSGRHCRAFAFHVHTVAGGPGQLECSLVSRNDDIVLGAWSSLPVHREGWIVCEAPSDIPWRHRNIEFVLGWTGRPEHAPAISVTRGAGLERFFARADGVPRNEERLALRVWVGQAGSQGAGGRIAADVSAFDGSSEYALPVTTAMIAEHRPLVERTLGAWPWINVDDTAIMVHPTAGGLPSLVAVPLNAGRAIEGVEVVVSSPNADAPALDILVAVFPGGDIGPIDQQSVDPLPVDKALASSGWLRLEPGSAVPVRLKAPRNGPAATLVYGTRDSGGGVDHGHVWFRSPTMVTRR